MIFEALLFGIAIATVMSSIDFISKSLSDITHMLGIPEYLTSTIVLSFVISLPSFLVMIYSNYYNMSEVGIATVIGFSVTTVTLIMGLFLLKNEISVEPEGYRNATFVWGAALLFLIVSIDKLIDRFDAIFMIMLFVFYALYMYYRTSMAKEYTYLKIKKANMFLFPAAIVAVIVGSFAVVGTTIALSALAPILGFVLLVLGFLLAIPTWDVISSVFKSPNLTFDNLLGNMVVNLTLIPGIVALVTPMVNTVDLTVLLILNVVCLSFTVLSKAVRSMHKKTGIALILIYLFYVIYVIIGL